MGQAKALWMEDQERGWRLIDGKYACPECFYDPDIQSFIRREATEHVCSYCGESSVDTPLAVDMNRIMEVVMDGLRLEWGDPNDQGMAWESREGGWLGVVLNSNELFDEIGFGVASGELHWDIYSAIEDRQWCRRYLYGLLPQQELISHWNYFRNLVTHKVRFVFDRFKDESADDYGGRTSVRPDVILDTLGKVISRLGLIRVIPSGTEFFRARLHKESETYSTIGELGPPPAKLARFSNRMSPAGIPMFYGSVEQTTAVMEVRVGARYPAVVTIGRFLTKNNLNILDLTKVPPEPGLFDIANHEIRPACIFLKEFVADLTKPVSKDGREHIEYVPSQIVTEYFRHVFRDDEELPIHGILYPSAVQEGGTSCVLFFGPVSDHEFLVDENAVDQWLSLESVERKVLQEG